MKTVSLLLAGFLLSFHASAESAKSCPGEKRKQDIVEIAVENGNFKTLVAAVSAAGLVETLKSEGPFTVFAPTDAAFAALPAGTVEALLADIPALTKILTYHVVAGKFKSSRLAWRDEVTTVLGQKVRVEFRGHDLYLNDSKVILKNIKAKNGIIHVIDAVLLPL